MGLKSVPSVVQLPGGIKLNAIQFKVTEYDEHGVAKVFAICPPGVQGDWVLFAHEESIRARSKKR